ncbi:MAG: hypothetical protein IJG18_11845 [Kiritimatiellae bacterium]|nr:hypothetical protein [Kiritimatiellia bacterium]
MNMIALILAATLSAGNAEFDSTARDGARDISLSRAREELREKGPAPGALEKAMLADPKKFEKPAEAEALCRGVFADELRAQFAAKARAIAERLGIESDKLELDAGKADEIANKHFASAFAAERKAAVEAQAKTIVAATRPTEAEFDEKEDWELREQMQKRILDEQKTVVFSENRQFISERMVEPVIKDARREQKRQAEYLMRARCDTAAPSKLAADLKARLEENVKERREKADDPSKAWGVFTGTFEKSVGPAVERRTLDRLEKKMETTNVEVDVDSILKEIVEAPQKHVKQAESEKVFATRYSAVLLARALDGTCNDAPQSERGELREYLASRLGGERIQKAVEAKVRKDVLPKWREARATAAKRQADDTWPTLADGTWFPPADLADDVTARSDYAKSVKEWRSLSALKPLADAPKGRPLMEEADSRADSEVAAAFDIARSAIAAQNAIVDGSHAQVLAEAKKRKDSFWTRTPDLKTIVGLLTQATEESWEASRLNTLWPDEAKRPANAAEQHKSLFPSVRRKIELLARTILEEMNEPKPENEEKPEEPPPEEPQPDETPEEPPEVVEFEISVRRAGDEVEVSLKQGETVVESATVPAKKDDFENAMFKVTSAISRILGLK